MVNERAEPMSDSKPWGPEFRTCGFCKCYTNAAIRACCIAGRNTDLLRSELRKHGALQDEIDRLRAENARLLEACKAALHTNYFGCDCYSCSVLRAAIAEEGKS